VRDYSLLAELAPLSLIFPRKDRFRRQTLDGFARINPVIGDASQVPGEKTTAKVYYGHF
jgi:hypothetical protein